MEETVTNPNDGEAKEVENVNLELRRRIRIIVLLISLLNLNNFIILCSQWTLYKLLVVYWRADVS